MVTVFWETKKNTKCLEVPKTARPNLWIFGYLSSGLHQWCQGLEVWKWVSMFAQEPGYHQSKPPTAGKLKFKTGKCPPGKVQPASLSGKALEIFSLIPRILTPLACRNPLSQLLLILEDIRSDNSDEGRLPFQRRVAGLDCSVQFIEICLILHGPQD